MNTITAARWAMACALAAGIASATSAQAEEGVAIKNLLGEMGLINKDKDAIHYRERAPLVLPPKADLPPPASSEAYASNPDWPKDPDVMAKKRAAAEQRVPVTQSQVRRWSENNPAMSVEELRQGRDPNNGGTFVRRHAGDNDRDDILLTPEQLSVRKPEKDVKMVNGEPVRRTLTDPPGGFRKSAEGKAVVASRSAPAIDQQEYDANPFNWLKDRFKGNSDDE